MKGRALVGLGLVMIIAAAATVAAPPKPQMSSAAVDTLLACLDVPDAGARLACFETQARSLKEATAKRDVIVIDQADIQKTKRSLFGFTLPHIALFDTPAATSRDKGKDKKAEEPNVDRLETTVKQAFRGGNGLWTLVLEDDARWQQIEAGRESDEPRAGMKIDIRKATMGSYFAKIGSSIYMRIRRVS